MIEILGNLDCKEAAAARALERTIAEEWPAALGEEIRISLVVEALCFGEATQEIDILVLGTLGAGYTFRNLEGDSATLRSVAIALEVKDHSAGSVRFEGNRARVLYRGEWSDATEQNRRQVTSLRRFLTRSGVRPPWIGNAIWFRNLASTDVPVTQAALGSRIGWADLLRVSFPISKRMRHEQSTIETCVGLFSRRISPTPLDRKRLERLTKRALAGEEGIRGLVGTKPIILRGRGGTGKTVRLLRLANDLFESEGSRVLILTYNNALVADLTRLLLLLGIRQSVNDRVVKVQTVHSLFRALMTHFGILGAGGSDFLERYDTYKADLLEWLVSGGISSDEISNLRRLREFGWDYIFIDEGQDWPDDEKEILWRIYSPKQFVIADGIDQMVRQEGATDWRWSQAGPVPNQVVHLRTVLRLKRGLCEVVKAAAESLGHEMRAVEAHPDVVGGRVVVTVGSFERVEPTIRQELDRAISLGNAPLDCLMCVPPGAVDSTRTGLAEHSYPLWDGTGPDRRSIPLSEKQLRLVQYDSCRGLEGWTVFCQGIDAFFDHKMRVICRQRSEREPSTLTQQMVLSWLMIPLTRAIDTLVLNVEDDQHPLALTLRAVATEYPGMVTWVG